MNTQDAKERAQDLLRETDNCIRANPVPAILTALGIGFAIGVMSRCVESSPRREPWQEALDAHGGPFLFGRDFTLADAMFAPIVGRFLTWEPDLTPQSQAYVEAVRTHPLVARWYAEALAEPAEWQIPRYEAPV